MRHEANESIKNHEKAIEKYQLLMKKKLKEAQLKQQIKKKRPDFLDFEIPFQDEQKKINYEKTVGDFFNKINEMRKGRSFLGDIDDNEESLIEKETSFHINDKKQEFLLESNTIEEKFNQKVKTKYYYGFLYYFFLNFLFEKA